MLTILTGRSGSGKTTRILSEIGTAAESGKGGMTLLVPEQNSHEAERRLSAYCGPGINLYAEVLSFSRLADRIFSEVGGLAEPVLDKGGRIIMMSLALRAVKSRLRVYGSASEKAEFLEKFLDIWDDLKNSCITTDQLADAAKGSSGTLSDKLSDISLICGAYDALTKNIAIDPRDRLSKLADAVTESDFGKDGKIYIDGFSDFTLQELRIIEGFLKKGVHITVALTCCEQENPDVGGVFYVQQKAMARLAEIARRGGIRYEAIHMDEAAKNKAPDLTFIERNLFEAKRPFYGKASSAFELCCSGTLVGECEMAASKVIELTREHGYRFRDIALAARGFESIAPIVESIFEYYGIPVFLSRMADILSKPIISLVISALECVSGAWDHETVFRYLKTRLAGLSPDECDILENYVLKWSIRGSGWTSDRDWTQNPSGYASETTEKERSLLQNINELRRRAAAPLLKLREEGSKAKTAAGQAQALYRFVEGIDLARQLEARSSLNALSGDLQSAEEYRQLWEIFIGALDQMVSLLGETPMDQKEFSDLLKLVLSQYDVGSIPASLDCVTLGDMSRLRARKTKCLIIINASDTNIPGIGEEKGILSESEREELEALGISIADLPEERLYREMGLVYTALTLPDEHLILSYHGGVNDRPSFVFGRIEQMFGIKVNTEEMMADQWKTSAPGPCFDLALSDKKSELSEAARLYFENSENWKEKISAVRNSAGLTRGELAKNAAERLYGRKIKISASRADKFRTCRFSYFLRYGLKAQARRTAGIDAPEAGLFMHYILEKTTREAMDLGGFQSLSSDRVKKIAEKHIAAYLNEVYGGLEDKNGRFRYLFDRLSESALRIVFDMSEELRCSDFKPLGFELQFDNDSVSEEDDFTVIGAVDRIDGWVHEGRLYLRVVDYKTGRKSFDLSDIWYGMGMQTLIYLFELWKNGEEVYGKEIVPAGVLYAPARDIILNAPRNASDEAISNEMSKQLMRSGMLVNDPVVLKAMEKGEKFKYLPVKIQGDEISGKTLASYEQFGKLSRYVGRVLSDIGAEIRNGSIAADPYFKNRNEGACDYCEFKTACSFDDKGGQDKKRFLKRLSTDEAWNKIEREVEK